MNKKARKKWELTDIFPDFPPENSRGAALGNTFFRKDLLLLKCFRSWSRKIHHSCWFISAVSSKLVSGGQSYNLRWSGLFQKFLYLFKTFWEAMETSFSSKNSKQVVQTAIFMSKRATRKNFLLKFLTFWPKILSGFSSQHSKLPEKHFAAKDLFSRSFVFWKFFPGLK